MEGYIHNLSTVKTSHANQCKYFDFKIQISPTKTVKAVCYSPQKRTQLANALLTKSPVKIDQIKRKSSGDYVIRKKTKIAGLDSAALEFQYDEVLGNNLKTFKDASAATIYDTVDLKVKILSKSDKKQPVVINSNTKYTCDCFVADKTGTIKIALWEEIIDKIQNGKSYHFKNLKVRMFNDEKFLNTNEATTADEIPEISNIDMKTPEIQENLLTGQILGVDIKKMSCCIAEESAKESSEVITCTNCKMTTLASVFKTNLICQILLKSEDKITNYTCFTDAVDSFLKVYTDNNNSVDCISKDDLTKL